jgi:hypothetical protein
MQQDLKVIRPQFYEKVSFDSSNVLIVKKISFLSDFYLTVYMLRNSEVLFLDSLLTNDKTLLVFAY